MKLEDKKVKTDAEGQKTIGSSLFKYQYGISKDNFITTMNPTEIPMVTYREMLDDAGVLFPLWIIKLPIIRSRWYYTNPDDDIQSFVRANLERIWAKTIVPMLTSFEYGFAAFEKRFEVIDGKYWYKTFIDLLPEYIQIKIAQDGSYAGFEQHFPGRSAITVDVWKSLIISHGKSFGNHYGRSRLKTAHRYWIIDKSAYNFHAIAMQDYSIPTAIGRAPAGQTPVALDEKGAPIMKWNLDLIQDVAESIHSKSAVSFPAGNDWALELLSEKKAIYWKFIDDHKFFDQEKAKAIFVPEEIVTSGQGGSYAKAEVHSRWLGEMIEALQMNLANEYVLPYIIEPLVNLNFHDGQKKPPAGKFYFAPVAERDRDFLQDVFKKTFDSSDYKIGYKELADQFGLPLMPKQKETEEVMITRMARDIKSTGKFSGLDRKVLAVELRQAFNSGIQDVKEQMAFSGYVTMSSSDLVLLDQELKGFVERIRTFPQMDNISEVAGLLFKTTKSLCKKIGADTASKHIRRSL